MAGKNVNTNTVTKNGGILKFLKEVKAEIKKISWPKKEECKKALIAVAIVVLLYVILVGGLDFIFAHLFELILKLK